MELDGPGDLDKGEVECVGGECRVERAVVVGPAFVEVVIARGLDDAVCGFDVLDVVWEV